ncbi:MAG TPA: hypothetical protein VEQ65_11210 [Opitutus sp.]|nr:hypothetical protein [Opitutus sp.]
MNVRSLIIGLYLLLFLAVGAASGLYFWEAREEYNRLRQIEAASRRPGAGLERGGGLSPRAARPR